jgi:hypothetical protein
LTAPGISVNVKPLLELRISLCPACGKAIIQAIVNEERWLVVPRVDARRPMHESVPANLREDFLEAAAVLSISPKASAALARRCLQALLILQGAHSRDLKDQLDEIHPRLPSYVQSFVDNIRNLGNISAHPSQSHATGEILDVEPGEADWILELLEELFDHFYAKPAEAAARQSALSLKFADAGRLRAATS